ncbi:hypothetical protein BKA82DRAFT_994451 [Pisolithus tinctorius]|uniref:Uncharacterized protein n=1 Tax=Pisolithus tinctorius Marx 270 TaxID=870435 RepID=A0A0C3PDD8_PISTI|nr:hypothetical protein BKA82DRAFT_994451 [Pisolithus tinctorius]KIO11780.1 hypothetical protein M404DRAFT_994451 [Pisolithus tinctorius Marx 270]
MSSAGVEPSAIGHNTQPGQPTSDRSSSDELRDKGFPPQRHAGAVGLGPEYAITTGFSDKLQGLKEEVKGKILGKPELTEHGRERRTGELKRKEREQADTQDPFANPGGG